MFYPCSLVPWSSVTNPPPCSSPHQARQSLEKAKGMLEEERLNLTSELKTLQGGRMESDRGRKRAEGQLQELTARLGQADREREEREERLLKLQVRPSGREPGFNSRLQTLGTQRLAPIGLHTTAMKP